jgi:hypothetical protein
MLRYYRHRRVCSHGVLQKYSFLLMNAFYVVAIVAAMSCITSQTLLALHVLESSRQARTYYFARHPQGRNGTMHVALRELHGFPSVNPPRLWSM